MVVAKSPEKAFAMFRILVLVDFGSSKQVSCLASS
jgi:hypothetical protein